MAVFYISSPGLPCEMSVSSSPLIRTPFMSPLLSCFNLITFLSPYLQIGSHSEVPVLGLQHLNRGRVHKLGLNTFTCLVANIYQTHRSFQCESYWPFWLPDIVAFHGDVSNNYSAKYSTRYFSGR